MSASQGNLARIPTWARQLWKWEIIIIKLPYLQHTLTHTHRAADTRILCHAGKHRLLAHHPERSCIVVLMCWDLRGFPSSLVPHRWYCSDLTCRNEAMTLSDLFLGDSQLVAAIQSLVCCFVVVKRWNQAVDDQVGAVRGLYLTPQMVHKLLKVSENVKCQHVAIPVPPVIHISWPETHKPFSVLFFIEVDKTRKKKHLFHLESESMWLVFRFFSVCTQS